MSAQRRARGRAYFAERLDDFSGGWNTDKATTIARNELATAENVELTSSAKVKPRPGIKKRFAADFSASPVLGMGALYHSDGTTKLVIAAGTALYADNPHIAFTYDAQADWGTGTHNLDSVTAPGDMKLPAKPVPTFTRASVAYKDDFSQVLSGTGRFDFFWR